MRHSVIVLLTVVALSSCRLREGGVVAGGNEVIPTQFTRTFATAQCWSGQPIATSAPCSTYGAASHSLYVDSVRIAFSANNVVEWKIGTHRYECPCYLGGCSTPCSHAAPVVTQLTGSYTITADTVTLQFAQSPDPQASIPNTLKLRGSIPDRVPPDWAGPDSLLYGRVFGALIIKSP